MLEAIGTGVTQAIAFAGDVVQALTGAEGALQPLLGVVGLAVGIGIIGWGIATIKNLVWGM